MTIRSKSLQNFQTTRVLPPHSFVQIRWCTRSFFNWFISTIMMRMLVLFLLFTVYHTARATGSNCSLLSNPFECFNNSTCTTELHNATELDAYLADENIVVDIKKEYLRDDHHCRCLKGWTGLRCNTKYESCGAWGHKC